MAVVPKLFPSQMNVLTTKCRATQEQGILGANMPQNYKYFMRRHLQRKIKVKSLEPKKKSKKILTSKRRSSFKKKLPNYVFRHWPLWWSVSNQASSGKIEHWTELGCTEKGHVTKCHRRRSLLILAIQGDSKRLFDNNTTYKSIFNSCCSFFNKF